MPCYHPLHGYTKRGGGWTANFAASTGSGARLSVPCGQCVGCRLERSRQWAVRCMHEAKLHERNVFVTLTYDKDHLPLGGSLDYRDFQLFMKRLRKRYGQGIRYYMAGEYGDNFGRPHFHALLFNFDFPDKYYWCSRNGNRTFRSRALDGMPNGSVSRVVIDEEALWPFGNSELGEVNFQSAGYVARYCMKKITGHHADDHYTVVDEFTGEVIQREPEFNRMSLKPGIGAGFFEKFHNDIFPHDYVIVNGKKCKPPRYYDRCYELLDPDELIFVKQRRKAAARERLDDNTKDRLSVKERVILDKVSRLKRTLT